MFVPGGFPLLAPVVADLNEDGNIDVISTTYQLGLGVLVLLGRGDGTFAQAPDTGVAKANVVRIADLNLDGHQDLVAASDQLIVSLGRGDGTFSPPVQYDVGTGDLLQDPEAELWVAWLDVADLNADGVPDVIAANYVSNQLAISLGRGDGTFDDATLVGCRRCTTVAAADFDADGAVDLATTSFIPSRGEGAMSIYRNLGGGALDTPATFEHPCPVAIAIADLNGDGTPDIVTGNDACDTSSVLLGNGDATFTTAQSYAAGNCHTVAVADLDGDDIADVVTGSYEHSKLWFWRGTGDGTFVATEGIDISPALGTGVAVADVNNDGAADLVLGFTGQRGAVAVLLGTVR